MDASRPLPSAALGIAAIGVVAAAFVGGYHAGRTEARSDALESRVAALETSLQRAPAAAPAPSAAAAPDAPPAPDPARVMAALSEGAVHTTGPDDAPVTVVAFSDFECPFCARVAPTLDALREAYPGDVRVVFRHFPLPMHVRALDAHKAAVAAGRQGRFWEMHDRIFAEQAALDAGTLRRHAEAIGLDLARFDADFASADVAARIRADQETGSRVGVRGTPTFFVNGRLLSGAQPLPAFRAEVERALGREPELAAAVAREPAG